MEEVYALTQSAILVNVSLSKLSLVFTGKIFFRSHIRNVFEMISGGVQVLSSQATICPGFTVIPLRACRGSALPATWMQPRPCPRHELTQRVISLFPLSPARHTEAAVLMTRKYARSRRLRYANDIEQCLRGRFNTVRRHEHLARYSIRQQIAMLQDAQLFVGPHGAGLTQLLWLPAGAHVVEITPHPPFAGRNVANIYANMAAWSQHPYRAILEPARCTQLVQTIDAMDRATH
jgi:capsular polysaccharide biosynthesis protein